MTLKNSTTVKEIMSKGPVTLKPDDILYLANEVMSLGRIRHLPVVEGEQLIGILSQRDLLHSALALTLGLKPREEKEKLQTIRIREVMKQPVVTVTPETGIREAARIMIDRKIGCVPVVEKETLAGLVTETDILRYVAEQ